MSFEADLVTLLKTVCPRVYAGVAKLGTAKPYITYQAIGGRSLRWLDNTASDKRNTLVQVSAWSLTSAEALTLIRAAEDAMCASPPFVATCQGEPVSTVETDIEPYLYGSVQRFSVYSDR
jgi:hypothetical protein